METATAYSTSDLQLGSYLATLGHRLVRVEGPQNRRELFFTGVTDEDVASYYRGDRPVAPVALFTSYHSLKRAILGGRV